MLSRLNKLHKATQNLQAATLPEVLTSLTDQDLDRLLKMAFNIVSRAVKFLDVWNEDIKLEDNIDASIAVIGDMQTTSCKRSSSTEPPISGGADLATESANYDSKNTHNRSIPRSSSASANTVAVGDGHDPANTKLRHSCTSQSYVRPGATQCDIYSSRPSSTIVNMSSASHRHSCSTRPLVANPEFLVSTRLTQSHELLLTVLRSFVSPHLRSRPSTELLSGTKQVVSSCQDLLAIVDSIWERDLGRSSSLEKVRNEMYEKVSDLVNALQDIIQATSGEDKIFFDESRLNNAATACVRGAGECVAKAQFVIEKIGDFKFEIAGLGISSLNDMNLRSSIGEPYQVSYKEQSNAIPQSALDIPEPSHKPPLPPLQERQPRYSVQTDTLNMLHSPEVAKTVPTVSTNCSSVQSMLPPLPQLTSPLVSIRDSQDGFSPVSQVSVNTYSDIPSNTVQTLRTSSISRDAVLAPATEMEEPLKKGNDSTYIESVRNSEKSGVSLTSTRATSPDIQSQYIQEDSLLRRVGSTIDDDCEDTEAKILEKTFAHELVHNKDGLVTGGTLPALVERLTTCDSTPDAFFLSTFYLTFRLFATPTEFAQALIDRYGYVQDNENAQIPVRLRVYNVFKGWLESHWRSDCDVVALPLILTFAKEKLSSTHAGAGRRLIEMIEKISSGSHPTATRLISSMGKTNTSVAQYFAQETPLTLPIITKHQTNILKNWLNNGSPMSILDFDPLELARQLTIKESRIFCSILPEELLGTEWMKKSASVAVNVRAMSTISTDLANLVNDCILTMEDPQKRAKLIKQWVKIANKCSELNNYDSLMAIICSLSSATITRLKRTWDMVSAKTKATLESLKGIVELSRNYAVLRQRLQNQVPPCLPFVGIYLTDLAFVDAGNPSTRQLPSYDNEEGVSVINFDKHMKTAKIISDLQRFQIPYRLVEVPELQYWMQAQFVRVRSSGQEVFQNYYRRSLLLEPREQLTAKASPVETQSFKPSFKDGKEKFDVFSSMKWPNYGKEKLKPQ